MRTISYTSRFKRDYRREKAGRHRGTLDDDLTTTAHLFGGRRSAAAPVFRPCAFREWRDCRDCHVKPDFVLIYRKPNDTSLELVRLGSHSELGL